jgi:ATP-dependent Clp protease ATP-binding subunit ClpC
VFAPLGPEVLRSIVAREVEKVSAREGVRRHNVELRVDERALDVLADHGFDPRYGARPLKRTLERELALPIAAHLAARAEHGNARIDVTAEGRVPSRSRRRRWRRATRAGRRARSTRWRRPRGCGRRCGGGRAPTS